MKSAPKVVIPGGAGFLGRLLAPWLSERGWDVVILTRRPGSSPEHGRTIVWDGATAGEWAAELEGARAVVNLAGRSVNCRYHAKNRRLILDSRVNSTRALGEAIGNCRRPPEVWLNSSTATIYRHTCGPAMDEQGEIGGTPEAKDVFSVDVATAWERAFERAETPETRKVAMRTAIVLADEPGTAFAIFRRLTRLGLGGRMGHGRQFVSWIHGDDFCRAVEWLIEHDEFSGPVNLAAPRPVPNREMMQSFRRVYRRPFGLPAAGWMLEVGAFLLRTETELIIKSRRVIPARLLESGFAFRFEELEEAIRDLKNREVSKPLGRSAAVPLSISAPPE